MAVFCTLWVHARLVTVPPRHPSKYLKPLIRERRTALSTNGPRRKNTADDKTRSAFPAGDIGCKTGQFPRCVGTFSVNVANKGTTEYIQLTHLSIHVTPPLHVSAVVLQNVAHSAEAAAGGGGEESGYVLHSG
jgi:hypothetical protein